MRLVIKISDGLYNNLDTIKNGSIASQIILNCVREGQALPKGCGALKDADKIIKNAEKWGKNNPNKYIANRNADIVEIIKNEETIIEADKIESEKLTTNNDLKFEEEDLKQE